MGFHCDYYGKDWEDDDPACDDCEKWVSCKRLTLERKRKKKKSKAEKAPSFADLSNRITYSYHTNPRYVLPAEGEPAFERIIKNAVAAAMSAIGGEIFVFFQEWRWPFRPPAPTEKTQDEEDNSGVEEPKKHSKVAKKVRSNDPDDEDDDYGFDLDDL